MPDGDRLIGSDDPVYREFVRLYRIARELRPTSIDRWNGELYATDAGIWGSVSPVTGAVRLSATLVLPHLTGSTSHRYPVEQAEALATVLHESTHLGMRLKAVDEPNAVHSNHTYGLTEGIAELRAVVDFQPFTWRAGYGELVLPKPQYAGAYAATAQLLHQAGGRFDSQERLTTDLVTGPAAMHFDRLAAGIVRNQLRDMVPSHEIHQRAARAALIRPMLHGAWPLLPNHSAQTGERIAHEIQSALNAKVDEIRRHYRVRGGVPFAGESGVREVSREVSGGRAGVDSLRFLGGQAPAAEAVVRRPEVRGRGARVRSVRGPAHGAGPPNRRRGD